jgi:hypothetical protein
VNRGLGALACVVALAASTARSASAAPRWTEAPQHLADARKEGHYAFCTKPKLPLSAHDRALCSLASSTTGCEGFAAACRDADRAEDDSENERDHSSLSDEARAALGMLGRSLVWLLVLGVIAAAAFPLLRALLRARRDRTIAKAPAPPNVALPVARTILPAPEESAGADAALREADALAARGDYSRALGLYLAASLAALDRRGVIRLARHRTNGEYVRSCTDAAAREALREIVREVDRVEFGKVTPASDVVARVAARATSVVRAPGVPAPRGGASLASMTTMMLCALLLAGCGRGGEIARSFERGNDPGGDELPIDVLRRSGFEPAYLSTSLGSLPIPTAADSAPVVVVDVTRVVLEEESSAHLMRWVEAGGVLVLFGPPERWPSDLHAERAVAEDDRVDVSSGDVRSPGARVGVPSALSWEGSTPVAFSGTSVYAAHIDRGQGIVFGVAGRELFTNVGVARPDNAAAFVALLEIAMKERDVRDAARDVDDPAPPEIRVAQPQDGIPPLGDPFSALVQAGLGKGAWHGLAAAMVLFLAYGIRHARARAPAPASRRAFAEHVEATGAFYGRARATGHALASYGHFAEMRLREHVPRGADPVSFLASRANVPHAEAARVWKRATEARAEDPRRGDELAVIRDLGAMLAKALEPAG